MRTSNGNRQTMERWRRISLQDVIDVSITSLITRAKPSDNKGKKMTPGIGQSHCMLAISEKKTNIKAYKQTHKRRIHHFWDN